MGKTSTSRFSYGWVVLFSCFMITSISYGIQYSFGVFFKSLVEEFGCTRAMLSSVFSIFMIMYGVFGVVMGGIADRYGAKVIVAVGGLIMGFSLIIVSKVENFWQYCIFYGILVAIGRGAGYVPLQSTALRWFPKKKA